MRLRSAQVADPAAQQNFEQIQQFCDIGDLKPTMRATAPPGWLPCDGRTLNSSDYPALAEALGITAATFTLPDLRGRAPIGAGQGTGLTNRTLSSTGGEETHVLTTGEMPVHSHAQTLVYSDAHENGYGYPYSASSANTGAYAGANTQNAGSGQAHNNMQPWVAVNWVIKT